MLVNTVRHACAYGVKISRHIEKPSVLVLTIGDMFQNERCLYLSGTIVVCVMATQVLGDVLMLLRWKYMQHMARHFEGDDNA